jgi:rhodanese-related sulfurtransferase
MNEIINFAQQHIFLVVGWLVILIAIVINELLNHRLKAPQISPQQLVELMNNDKIKVIDIRNSQNFRQSHILNSKNIPWLNQDHTVFQSVKNEPIVLVCQQGLTTNQLADTLKKQGFNQIQVLNGGLNAWQQASLPLVKGK